MKLVFATPFLRFPPDFGHAVRNYHILNRLIAHHAVTIVTFGNDENGSTDAWLAERGATVLRLPFALPWANSSGYRAALRMLTDYPGASFRRFNPRGLADRIDALCYEQPDVDFVLFDTQLAGQARLYSASTRPSVLMMLDVYEVYQWRKFLATGWRPWAAVEMVTWLKTRSYERRILRQFRHVVTVSPVDQEFVARNLPSARVGLSPNGVDVDYFKPIYGNRQSGTLLFVGNFDYGPNVDAFFYFCREILPLIRADRPEAHLLVAGRSPSAAMKTFAENDPGISLTGAVADMRPFYAQAAIAVIPVRVGSGVKLKTLEAMAMGMPVVSTSVGCEGIGARDGEHLAIADSPKAFARQVLRLLDDPIQAQAMAGRARKLIEERYDWKVIAGAFEDQIAAIASAYAEQQMPSRARQPVDV